MKGSQSLQRFSPVSAIPTGLSTHSTQPIKIPVPIHENGMLRGTPGKARASVEGLNPVSTNILIDWLVEGCVESNTSSDWLSECYDKC